MNAVLSSPGSIVAFTAVLVLEAASLLLLVVNIQLFRSQSDRYRLLLAKMGDQSLWGHPGRVLLPLYVLLVLGVTIVTTLIFLFQPHFL